MTIRVLINPHSSGDNSAEQYCGGELNIISMQIKSIQIKNVRGIQDKTIYLDMIPNKPSILVAPNGSGKSSFAFAFQWLNRLRLKLEKDDAYNGDVNNNPQLIITTDEPDNNTYIADENVNNVSKKFGIFVINNGLMASSPGQHNGVLIGKAKITISDIELLGKKPNDVNLKDDFDEVYDTAAMPQGFLPLINALLNNNRFIASCDIDKLKMKAKQAKVINDQIEQIKTYTGTVAERHLKVEGSNKAVLEEIPAILYAENVLRRFCGNDNDTKLLLKAIRLVTLVYRKKQDFKGRVVLANYKINEDSSRTLFDALKKTWKDIKPHRVHGKVILRIGDAQRISNGERDILILLGMLQKAKNSFIKPDNILVIDEVFDYLDDANLVAAQHYVNTFIRELKDEGKNIYPIILSHINPIYFRTFAFKDMKVYYLNPLQYPDASNNMMKVVRKRFELETQNKEKANLISKYMLHYHPDYSRSMDDVIGMKDPNWNNIPTFKAYCFRQTEEYLKGKRYDALAVCVALREMIEKYCYQKLETEEQKIHFLDNSLGTENKINYVEKFNIVLPETFSLLGLIYNDPLHPNNKNKIDLRQTLYSRLENNTIKGMISEIKKMYEALL